MKDISSKLVLADYEDYNIFRENLSKNQLIVFDRIIKHIENNKIFLYYHKTAEGDIDLTKPIYTGLGAAYRPFGCELAVLKWYYKIITAQELLWYIERYVTKDGKRTEGEHYTNINFISGDLAVYEPFYAVYQDGMFSLYIQEMLYTNMGLYVFVVLGNGLLKRVVVNGNGRQSYFKWNGNKIKLSKLKYL